MGIKTGFIFLQTSCILDEVPNAFLDLGWRNERYETIFIFPSVNPEDGCLIVFEDDATGDRMLAKQALKEMYPTARHTLLDSFPAGFKSSPGMVYRLYNDECNLELLSVRLDVETRLYNQVFKGK